MTRLTVAPQVCAAFPGLLIDAVVADGFAGTAPWPAVAGRLAALEAEAAAGKVLAAGEDDPHIAAWHAAYRAFGTNPRRERPSAGALRRRLARSGRLPRINPAVDCYNLVSVSHGGPGRRIRPAPGRRGHRGPPGGRRRRVHAAGRARHGGNTPVIRRSRPADLTARERPDSPGR